MNEIRDPIYGFIKPSDKELKIINTYLLQRLRRIKQLAMAHLVYPGANHTRFDHSLGVYHITSLMSDELLPGKEHEERRNIIRYAALLHDVGHGPALRHWAHGGQDGGRHAGSAVVIAAKGTIERIREQVQNVE